MDVDALFAYWYLRLHYGSLDLSMKRTKEVQFKRHIDDHMIICLPLFQHMLLIIIDGDISVTIVEHQTDDQ